MIFLPLKMRPIWESNFCTDISIHTALNTMNMQ
jgi:hypothetical protein